MDLARRGQTVERPIDLMKSAVVAHEVAHEVTAALSSILAAQSPSLRP